MSKRINLVRRRSVAIGAAVLLLACHDQLGGHRRRPDSRPRWQEHRHRRQSGGRRPHRRHRHRRRRPVGQRVRLRRGGRLVRPRARARERRRAAHGRRRGRLAVAVPRLRRELDHRQAGRRDRRHGAGRSGSRCLRGHASSRPTACSTSPSSISTAWSSRAVRRSRFPPAASTCRRCRSRRRIRSRAPRSRSRPTSRPVPSPVGAGTFKELPGTVTGWASDDHVPSPNVWLNTDVATPVAFPGRRHRGRQRRGGCLRHLARRQPVNPCLRSDRQPDQPGARRREGRHRRTRARSSSRGPARSKPRSPVGARAKTPARRRRS